MDKHRESLLNGLTDFLVNQNQIKVASDQKADGRIEKNASMLKTASEMLRYAAKRTKDLEAENEKLAADNRNLQAMLSFEQRKAQAEKLASVMQQKGLIKHSEVSNKAAELSLMEDVGFEILKTAVENFYIERTASSDGVDSLTFLDQGLNIDSEESSTQSFAQSLGSMI